MPNYTKKAVRGAGIVFVMMVASYFLGYIFRVIIARELGASSYGLVYGIIALFGCFSIVMSLGLESALVKHIAEFKVDKKFREIKGSIIIVLLSKLLLSAFVCGGLIMFSDRIALGYFKTPDASLLIKIYGFGIFFSAIIATLKVSFQGFQSMRYYSSIDFTKSVIVLAITIPLIWMGFGEMAPILGFSLAFAIFLPLIYIPLLIIKVFPEFLKTSADLNGTLAKKLFGFGIPVAFVSLSSMLFSHTDTVILTWYRPLTEVGFYNAALPTMKFISVIGFTIASVVFPLSSELWAKKRKEHLSRGLGMLYKYVLIITFPIAILMFLFPEIILGILFGTEFGAAGNVLRILSVGYMIFTFAEVNNSVLSGIGKPESVSRIMLIGAGLNLILNRLLIPIYGMNGAAISTSFAFIMIMYMSTRELNAFVKFRICKMEILKIIFSSIIFALLVYLVKEQVDMDILIETTIAVVIGLFLYLAILFISGILTRGEIGEIISKIR